jgi:hypothetical protein
MRAYIFYHVSFNYTNVMALSYVCCCHLPQILRRKGICDGEEVTLTALEVFVFCCIPQGWSFH